MVLVGKRLEEKARSGSDMWAADISSTAPISSAKQYQAKVGIIPNLTSI